jgi:hypothetical protein
MDTPLYLNFSVILIGNCFIELYDRHCVVEGVARLRYNIFYKSNSTPPLNTILLYKNSQFGVSFNLTNFLNLPSIYIEALNLNYLLECLVGMVVVIL